MSALRDLSILVIAVGDDSPDLFRETAKSLGILERCRFERPRADVLDFYAAADLYVSPSQEDSFGMPVAEAMAAGHHLDFCWRILSSSRWRGQLNPA